MTPLPLPTALKARFVEVAEALGIRCSFRSRQGRLFYLHVSSNDFRQSDQFVRETFPTAWLTSGGGGQLTFGLSAQEVERVLLDLALDPAWLQSNDSAALRIARSIRAERAFDQLPVLADALEEAGCDNAAILAHCRETVPHGRTCWVVELLIAAGRK